MNCARIRQYKAVSYFILCFPLSKHVFFIILNFGLVLFQISEWLFDIGNRLFENGKWLFEIVYWLFGFQ